MRGKALCIIGVAFVQIHSYKLCLQTLGQSVPQSSVKQDHSESPGPLWTAVPATLS